MIFSFFQLISQVETPLSPDGFSGLGGPFDTVDDPEVKLEALLSTIIGFVTVVAGLAFLLYFMLGALQWITSQGDPQKVEAAKNQMTAAGMGLVIIVAAYAITGVVGLVLGIDILSPARTLGSFLP